MTQISLIMSKLMISDNEHIIHFVIKMGSRREHVAEIHLKSMINGDKTKEGRVISLKWNDQLIGSVITFYNNERSLDVKITNVTVYNGVDLKDAVRKMLSDGDNLKLMLPHAQSIDDGVDTYSKLYSGKLNAMSIGAFEFVKV